MATTDPTTSALQLDLFAERWRPVVGYEDSYEVSNHGRVRSIARIIPGGRWGHQARQGKDLRLRMCWNPARNNTRHTEVVLCKEGINTRKNVHHLVLEAFIGKRPEHHTCNHKDGNPSNNRIENLEWVTHSRNVQHGYEMGLYVARRGTQHAMARLTEQEVKDIRALSNAGISYDKLAAQFRSSKSNIARIVRRQNWTHI